MITRLTLPGKIEGCYNGSFSPLSSDNGIETVMNGFGDLKQVLISSVVSSRVLYVCMYVWMDGWKQTSRWNPLVKVGGIVFFSYDLLTSYICPFIHPDSHSSWGRQSYGCEQQEFLRRDPHPL